jgi:hypothetical protein
MYGTLTDFRSYHTERGNSAPTDASDPLATAALVRASDYIRVHYVARLATGYDDTLDQIEEATYIAAALELTTPGFFSKTYTESERKVLTKVESLQWQVVGSPDKTDAMSPRSNMIEALLRPYLNTYEISGGLVV